MYCINYNNYFLISDQQNTPLKIFVTQNTELYGNLSYEILNRMTCIQH